MGILANQHLATGSLLDTGSTWLPKPQENGSKTSDDPTSHPTPRNKSAHGRGVFYDITTSSLTFLHINITVGLLKYVTIFPHDLLLI